MNPPPISPMEDHKQLERAYYDRTVTAASTSDSDLFVHGPMGVEDHLRAPYIEYQQAIARLSSPGAVIVELGAGTGLHSFLAAKEAMPVLATDISIASLKLAKKRAHALGREILPVVADGERLPVRDQSVDLCTSAGVLYCLDMPRVLDEVVRVLKPNGSWIIVDSLNHNPVYRMNRLVGYWRGRRTRRAYTSIPNDATLDLLRRHFADVSPHYFGVWSFVWPVLRRLVGRRLATATLAALEPPRWLSRYAFKIVVVARFPSTGLTNARTG